MIGDDLNGYVLEDVTIDYLEQTPKSSLDPNNILDAEDIKDHRNNSNPKYSD